MIVSGCDTGSQVEFKIKNSMKTEQVYYEADGDFGMKNGNIDARKIADVGEVTNSPMEGIGIRELKIYSDLEKTKLLYSYSKLNRQNDYEEFDIDSAGDIIFEMTEDKIIK
jgi:hypothetical protein